MDKIIHKKKVLFLITKSNWGEKVFAHFRKRLPARKSDNLNSVCKTAHKPTQSNAATILYEIQN